MDPNRRTIQLPRISAHETRETHEKEISSPPATLRRRHARRSPERKRIGEGGSGVLGKGQENTQECVQQKKQREVKPVELHLAQTFLRITFVSFA